MEKQEQTEWDAVNRLLQHQGFKPVRFADPTENKNLADLVLLERTSASELRITLKTMLMDSERRQALIEELIQSNSKLKQEVEQQQARAVRQSYRAEELEGVLAGVKVKVQGLEDSIINKAAQQQGQLQQLQQDKREVQMLCQALQQQLSEQESQVCELQKNLQLSVKEEEKRASRQNQAFQQFLSRSARLHSPTDQLVLDVISVYESQLQQLQDKLKVDRRHIEPYGLGMGCHLSSYASQGRTLWQCILSDITAVLTNPRAPLALPRRPDGATGSELEQIVPVLEMWSQQLGALPDLQHAVSRLMRRLLPWQREDQAYPQCVKVEDVMLMVDTLLDETTPDNKVLRTPTKPTLQAMVSHFQMLFDVVSIRGVYPRMNEVYTRLAEMTNAMRNLRDILDMDESASPGNVVNMVARILTGTSSSQNPHKLLRTSDRQ
ncbi:hypothetical protein KOW79_021453 [Hemibagrus wyckioides]|uniref:Centrosomal protein of 70 kDa n=1 Tax=Hemibagrus wyckioides TaxID=337641 RepID=A0A9D3S9I3_9TELE|nr:hypothetical protein KOW79_021453 [Hemibagrus wyckioides]